MTAPLPGEARCQRSGCTADGTLVADHQGKEHLDPGSPLYDGPGILLNAMPMSCRRQMLAAWHAAMSDDVPLHVRQAVLHALDAAGREIDRLRQQVAAVRVDADHQIRDAMARAADCDVHGDDIRTLDEQLRIWAADRDRIERARVALLGEHHVIDQLLDGWDDSPTPMKAEAVRALLVDAHKKASNAHKRAWNANRR